MLHFPSTSTAADAARPADVLRLRALLGDHVWAFSNCRVDAPGLPVAEVDWLFHNSRTGTFLVSEWKHYPSPVAEAPDEGKPWVLSDGTRVANPVEQVTRQTRAVRRALRSDIRDQHFPGVEELAVNPYQAVYSPQVTETTQIERLRYGRVHATLDDLAVTIERIAGPAPLVVEAPAQRLGLAEALADLFRCSISNGVRRKIHPPQTLPPQPSTRIAAIHRELAALHLELAALLEPRDAPSTPPPPGGEAPRAAPIDPASHPGKGVHAVARPILQGHVERLVPPSSATAVHLNAAFIAAVQDDRLGTSGLHVGLFGALVAHRLSGATTLKALVPGGLRKWCLAQAVAAGIPVEPDQLDPSILRRIATTHPHEDVG